MMFVGGTTASVLVLLERVPETKYLEATRREHMRAEEEVESNERRLDMSTKRKAQNPRAHKRSRASCNKRALLTTQNSHMYLLRMQGAIRSNIHDNEI